MAETLDRSTITVAELRVGLLTMPDGKRRRIYQERLERESIEYLSFSTVIRHAVAITTPLASLARIIDAMRRNPPLSGLQPTHPGETLGEDIPWPPAWPRPCLPGASASRAGPSTI